MLLLGAKEWFLIFNDACVHGTAAAYAKLKYCLDILGTTSRTPLRMHGNAVWKALLSPEIGL
jgi:hypothetical protein